MTTIAIPFTVNLAAAFRAVLAFASKDSASPSIMAVSVNNRFIIATDRFAIGRYEHTTYAESVERYGEAGPADPNATVTIPREVAEWLGKQKPMPYQHLTLTLTADTATISYEGGVTLTSMTYAEYSYNFPAVDRLMVESSDDDVQVFPFALGTDRFDQLTKAGRALAKEAGKNAGWRFQLPGATDARKTAPIRASLGERMVVMIQPMLVLR